MRKSKRKAQRREHRIPNGNARFDRVGERTPKDQRRERGWQRDESREVSK